MDKSLKIGAVAGLIAGIVLGIGFEFFYRIGNSLGLHELWWRSITTGNSIVNIPLFGFWGVVLGIIYSKVYFVIPKQRILKGLIYGLFLFFIIEIRIETFNVAYGHITQTIGNIFSQIIPWIIYGLLVGTLYSRLLYGNQYPIIEKTKIRTYNAGSGILPGAIAGLCGGIAASIFAVIGHVTGYWGVVTAGEIISTIDFWMSQAGSHIFINMLWGIIFGMIYTKVYDLVFGKGILKGLYYGLIVFMVTSFLIGTYWVFWLIFHNEWIVAQYLAGAQWVIGTAQFIAFGLMLGILYRKPTK